MRDFTLGTMYWINPKHGRKEFEEDMSRIKDNNFSLIRIFIMWEYVEEVEGKYDFLNIDKLFAAADKYGIKVMATIGFYLPFWLTCKLDKAGINDAGRYPCLERPEVINPLIKYIKAMVNKYKDSPALAYWNLWNEPTANDTKCKPVLEKFLVWLKKRYSTSRELQAAWNGEHSIFKLVCPASLDELSLEWIEQALRLADRGRCATIQYDYHRFTMWNLGEQLTLIGQTVKSIDTVHPTHTNLHSMSLNPVSAGQERFNLPELVDTISFSVHVSNDYERGEEVCDRAGNFACGVDQAFSWTKGKKPTWTGELQAGTTFCHWNQHTPSAATVSYELWRSLGGGLDGVVFWQWQSWRAGLFEIGEFSLRNASDGAATERSEAVKEFGKLYLDNKKFFDEVKRPLSKVAILYSEDTFTAKFMQGKEMPMIDDYMNDANYALFGCYRALSRANISVEFISEEQIEKSGLEQYKVLYIPGVELMREQVVEKIKGFVRIGGAVYADGRSAFLDEHLYLRNKVPGHGLAEVFGACEADFIATDELKITTEDEFEIDAYVFAQYLNPLGDARVTAHFPGGQCAVVDNCYGEGRTRLVGTGLCRSLREFDNIDVMNYIADFALKSGISSELIVNSGFSGKRLVSDKHDIIIVNNNTGKTSKAKISADCETVKCLHGEADFDGEFITKEFFENETVVFILLK